jgi:acyl dehydratase
MSGAEVERSGRFDATAAQAAPPCTVETTWNRDLVVRYQLAIGAGDDPLDPRALRYVIEDDLVVLPSFGVVVGSDAATLVSAGSAFGADPSLLVQGEQSIEVHTPMPPEGRARSTAWVESVHDTGRAAIVTIRSDTALVEAGDATAADGVPLCTSRFTLVLRGEGGFGGAPPPAVDAHLAPAPSAAVVELPTVRQQALWYRTVGDRNALHHDPVAARAAGFDAPPLQGLCTWAMVGRVLVDHVVEGDVEAVAALSARFAGPVYPGETLRVRWQRDGATVVAEADVVEREAPALRRVLLRMR